MRALAQKYHDLGINIVPLGNDKRPVITGVAKSGALLRFRWDDYQSQRQTDAIFQEMRRPAWWKEVKGVAAICGPVSNNLVCVDFDAPQGKNDGFPQSIIDSFLQALGEAKPWIVRTPRGGWHLWLRCPDLELDKGKLDRAARNLSKGHHIEIRWQGHYVVLPGSLHPNGGIYQFVPSEPDGLPGTVSAADLLAAYDAVTVAETPNERSNGVAPESLPRHRSGAYGGVSAYAMRALEEEAGRVRSARSGGRNETLNVAAFALGQLVAGGELDQGTVEDELLRAALDCGLGEGEARATIASGLNAGFAQPRQAPEQSNGRAPDRETYTGDTVTVAEAEAIINGTDTGDSSGEGEDIDGFNPWPYAIEGGRLIWKFETKDGIESRPICDYTARIVEEITDEDGEKTFTIVGSGLRGGPYRMEISASEFGEERRLRAQLTAAVGALDGVYNKMGSHLQPAIQKVSDKREMQAVKRFNRVGWLNNHFLFPGRMPGNWRIDLYRQLPYGIPAANVTLNEALPIFEQLIVSVKPQISTPVLAMMLQATIHRIVGWNKRYGVFIQGRTGSLKTSWSQVAMAIFGEGWNDDSNLMKWGEGATRNSLMHIAAHAHDMTILIDNYKPNTGGGQKDFENLIQNLIEGGDKIRMQRSRNELRESKPVHCFPLFTGEDQPSEDAASLVRILLIAFEWQPGTPNDDLTNVQEHVHLLPVIGTTWLDWIESKDGQQIACDIAKDFPAARSRWANRLRGVRTDIVNVLRLASNLATNELTWRIAEQHPRLGFIFKAYAPAHLEGLNVIAERMAKSTAEALEAQQFLAALRELLSTGQYVLVERNVGQPSDLDKDRTLGWYDNQGIYLLPALALQVIRRMLGPGSIPISTQALYNQLAGLKLLASTGADRATKKIAIGKERPRVLHLKTDVLQGGDEDESEANNEGAESNDDGEDSLAKLGI